MDKQHSGHSTLRKAEANGTNGTHGTNGVNGHSEPSVPIWEVVGGALASRERIRESRCERSVVDKE